MRVPATGRDPILEHLKGSGDNARVGRYVLDERIGRGGMGAVYLAQAEEERLPVAIKVLFPSSSHSDQPTPGRFRREVQVGIDLNHPNLVRTLHAGVERGLHYLVMEYVDGETARSLVHRNGRLAELVALKILLSAARGATAVHDAGVVHRDIKPDNILLSSGGVIKLGDFGLVKALDDSHRLTRSNVRLGTPGYMPPEQWENPRNTTPATDVWALGATLYFLLAGRDPDMRVLLSGQFPRIDAERSGIRPELSALLQRCTEHDPAKRYTCGRELCSALESLLLSDTPGPHADQVSSTSVKEVDVLSRRKVPRLAMLEGELNACLDNIRQLEKYLQLDVGKKGLRRIIQELELRRKRVAALEDEILELMIQEEEQVERENLPRRGLFGRVWAWLRRWNRN